MARNRNNRPQHVVHGEIDYCQRLVRSNGRIKLDRRWWQDDRLIPFIGEFVGVHVEDYWHQSVSIFWPEYPSGDFIIRMGEDVITMSIYYEIIGRKRNI